MAVVGILSFAIASMNSTQTSTSKYQGALLRDGRYNDLHLPVVQTVEHVSCRVGRRQLCPRPSALFFSLMRILNVRVSDPQAALFNMKPLLHLPDVSQLVYLTTTSSSQCHHLLPRVCQHDAPTGADLKQYSYDTIVRGAMLIVLLHCQS